MFYRLTPKDTRRSAFVYAVKNNCKITESWNINGMAGTEWLHHFKRRHHGLSIRMPEATLLARDSAFNRVNVARFFDILEAAILKTQIS